MNYSKLTTKNNNFIKRFSHSRRFITTSKIISKFKSNKILDYGSGNGELYKYLDKSKKKNFYFYEPNILMTKELKYNLKRYKINKIFTKPSEIYNNYFDLICINEVFEHLNNIEQKKVLKHLRKISKAKCIILISIPIEVGFSSIFKNVIRIITGQKHKNTNLKNLLKSLFYIKLKRSNKKYNDSHIGFNYLDFIKFLKKNKIKIFNVYYSPINFLRGLLNSQIFITAEFL